MFDWKMQTRDFLARKMRDDDIEMLYHGWNRMKREKYRGDWRLYEWRVGGFRKQSVSISVGNATKTELLREVLPTARRILWNSR